MIKITIEELRAWVLNGSRSAEYKIENHRQDDEPREKVWCYDYDLMAGKHITDASELPDKEELKAILIADAEKRLKHLQDA